MANSELEHVRRGPKSSSPRCVVLCLICLVTIPQVLTAQLTMASAISLALQHSARIRSAQLDVQKAEAALAVAKDLFIPSVTTGGGLGWTYGITLTVPTIFTVNAQSLVYSNQQRFQIRAARDDLEAGRYALAEARQEVEEDVAITCLNLQENQAAQSAYAEQHDAAERLIAILHDRVNAGLDSEIDLKKAERGVLAIELQQMQAEADRAALIAHLEELTGLTEAHLETTAGVPAIPDTHTPVIGSEANAFVSAGISAMDASARGKLERARGDAAYAWRPIITFGAQYGRVSPINDVSSFYNLHGNYNTANVGVQFQFPLLDRVRRAAARVSMADAEHAALDLQNKRADEAAGRIKLQRSIRIMATKAEMAELDYEIARQELKSTTIQEHASGGSAPLTPKEEQNARLQERQKYLELLDARLQLDKTKISFLRQTGELDAWVQSLLRTPAAP